MKSIRYIFTAILLLGAGYISAQDCGTVGLILPPSYPDYPNGKPWSMTVCITPATVHTPKGNPVPVYQMSNEWTSSEKNDMKSVCLNYYGDRITFEAEATTKYNCHAYAWDGGTTYWMNPPNQAAYWNDGSYVKISTTPPAGAKVRYTASDHSAILTSMAGEFSSKWGPGPQFRHSIDDSPFLVTNPTTDLEYYVIPIPPIPISISGPAKVCVNSSASFSVNNAPTGYT